jgi:hypothetical protein
MSVVRKLNRLVGNCRYFHLWVVSRRRFPRMWTLAIVLFVPLSAYVSGQNTSITAPSQTGPNELRVRRVVTGHNAQGKSCVVSDELVDGRDLWKTSGKERLGPKHPEEPDFLPSDRPQADPPPGGTWWRLVAYPPTKDPKPTLANRQGFHRTATIDYAYVLSGEMILLLDVEEVKLKAGDVVIQRNTAHAWRNDGAVLARMLFTLIRVDP